MSKIIEKRVDGCFLFDTKDANPNGDPHENRPRVDEETQQCIVTDVRVKRTIRDFWHDQMEKEVFIADIQHPDGTLKDGKARAKDFLKTERQTRSTLIDQCIDVRTFGVLAPTQGNSVKFTGPTQVSMGRSLHQTQEVPVKGTGAFASKNKAKQNTFREEYVLPYALIGHNFVVNENLAKISKMTMDDFEDFKQAIWNGTNSLTSRSKYGQRSKLLLTVTYNNQESIGDLRRHIQLRAETDDLAIRDCKDYQLDVTNLVDKLNHHQDKIDSVDLKIDSELQCTYNDEVIDWNDALSVNNVNVNLV